MTTSWDCFDTLVARRRFDPLTVFDDMSKKLELDNFTQRRKAAESRAPWTLDSIYEELAKDYGWGEYEKAYYKEQEILAEIDHCCPVGETIRQVKDGDLIVSDMYLPAWAIELILRNCGLDKEITVYVSTGGKSSGAIWRSLLPIEKHIGDNYHSDVTSPQAHGIQGIHFTKTGFTELEQRIGGDLALLMRIVRIANPYEPGTVLGVMWDEQAQLNIPTLVLAALEIPERGVAFVTRDCVHLQPIHEAIHGTINPSFHCSRLAFLGKSQGLKRHAEKAALGQTIVDLQGTGGSIARYWLEEFGEMPNLLYVTGTMPHGRLLAPCLHDAIERFNSSPLGSIGKEWPERLPCEYDEEVLMLQKRAVECAISHLPYFSIASNLEQLRMLVGLMPSSVTVKENNHSSSHE
jgi:hypothetical protein